jgi:tRNA1(Val) A37 N6-methylase TrmN6
VTGAARPLLCTRDAFLGGRLTLLQPKKGHRAGLDAALLQALVPATGSGLLIDLGAGVGTVAFSAAARAAALSAVAVERDSDLAALGRDALMLPENQAFASRVRVVVADAADRYSVTRAVGSGPEVASWVLMNPPFETPDRVRVSPDRSRRDAHVGDADLVRNWCRTAAALLRRGGTIGIIHRADAILAVLEALSGAFGRVSILPVHPAKDAAANRILVRAERASRAPLRLLSGLVLHQSGGEWTAEADAILRGREAILPEL